MVSFLRLWENMQDDDAGPLDDSGLESKGMEVIRTGNTLRGKSECGNFWEDFITICNDSQGLSELLGARSQEVQQWANKVREAREKVERADSQADKKNTMMPTGGGSDSSAPAQNPGDGPRKDGIPAQF